MRTKKAIKNILVSMLYQIVSIVCGLITPRMLLASFGSTYNGVVASATQFLSMISFLTLGIAGATRVALYKTLASDDTLGTSRIMKATRLYMRKVAMAVVGLSVVLMLVYPYISHNDLSHLESALLIGIVALSTFADYFLGISNRTLLTAAQETYIVFGINIATTILNTICVAVLIWGGGNIFVVKLGSALVYVIMPLILNIIVNRKFHLTKDCEPDYTAIEGRGAVAFHSIANIVHANTDLVILTLFTDAKIISVYTVYYLVVGKVKSLMQVFTNGMEAGFGDMWAKKEMKALKLNFRIYEFGLFTFTAIVFSCVGTLILPFLIRYTKGINDANYIDLTLTILITLAEGMYCVRQPYLTLVQAAGKYEETKNGAMLEAIINITTSLILVWKIGIYGVIVGTLLANIVRTSQYVYFSSKHILDRPIIDVIRRFLWLIVDSTLIVTVAIFVNKSIAFNPGWIGWVINAMIVFVIACFMTLLMALLFYKNDVVACLNVVKRMLSRKR